MLPTIAWRGRSVIMIDQRKLPGQETYVRCHTYIQVAQAIEKMVIRGAPAIGIAAAYGGFNQGVFEALARRTCQQVNDYLAVHG